MDSPAIGLPQGDLYRGGKIGKYEILTQLSVGGMAELFLAFTSGPGGFRKFVVVKRILPDVRSNENFVRMFFDEARVTAALNHPNIGQVFDLHEEGGVPFLAMEFIAGQNLNQITRACMERKIPLPLGFTVSVVRELCHALHYAHTFTDPAGKPFPIIHRDVAQKNVMVTYDGQVKLLDFGIAKARGSLGRTSVGMVKGTTGYMSPEQVRGEELDGRSDVFSVGVMLHELLSGKRLFAAPTELEEMEKILSAPIPKLTQLEPKLPETLSTVVAQALARRREDRIPSAKALARALEQAVPRHLFDQDRRAAFMREHFAAKLSATRALLDSAGDEMNDGARAAAKALTSDVGMVFPEGAQVGQEVPTASDQLPLVPSAQPTKQVWVGSRWLAGLAAIVVLASAGGYLIIDRLMTGGQTEQTDSASPSDEGLPDFDPSADHRARTRKQPVFIARPGTLTLVTTPEADAYAANQKLGTTPLVQVPLPAGLHKVRLVGPDGRTHVLTVDIEPSKNTSLRLLISEIPFE